MPAPLEGIKILDFTRFQNGPHATVMLSDMGADERSAVPFARAEHREWLMEELAVTIGNRPRQHWIDALVANDVPCSPVYEYARVAADSQFWDNGYLMELDHPHFEGHRVVGIPVQLSETPGGVQGPAPELGQHTEQVLLDLGYEWTEIEALRDGGVI